MAAGIKELRCQGFLYTQEKKSETKLLGLKKLGADLELLHSDSGSISTAFVPQHAEAATATTGIFATAGTTASLGSTPVVVDWNLSINYTANGGMLPGATAIINNFKSGDSLSVDENEAGRNGITVDKSNATNVVLILKGNVSAVNYQTILIRKNSSLS
jgi:hypothetical protein